MDIKALCTSKTIAGIVGALAVSLASGGDVGVVLTIGGKLYDLGNIAPYLVSGLSLLAGYGRLTASGPILNPNPAQVEPVADGSKGLPRMTS